MEIPMGKKKEFAENFWDNERFYVHKNQHDSHERYKRREK